MISAITNVASLRAQRVLRYNQQQMNVSLERLATGLRINRASDDPAGLIASENLRAEMTGIKAAIENATRAGNVLATAEGGLQEVSSLLNQLQGLVTQSANSGGLSSEEIAANQLQVDSILDTIDRLAGGTNFAGRKLLNGQLSYSTSGVSASQITDLHVYASQKEGVTSVNVNVVASARVAALTYTGGTVGTGGVTIEITGNLGSQQLSFSSGTTVSAIAAAVTSVRSTTGVSAVLSGGNVALVSTGYGSRAFATVRAVSGSFAGAAGSAFGRDATVTVNGAAATADGLNVIAKSGGIDVAFALGSAANVTNGVSSFSITGGGARFLLGPTVTANNFSSIGINAVDTGSLGSVVYGSLTSLRSGGTNSLSSKSLTNAQKILEQSIKQVSVERGRIGAMIKYDINSTINALQVRYENLAEAESAIRDTDFAAEATNLSRWQILSQAASSMLAQANQAPSIILRLLEGIR